MSCKFVTVLSLIAAAAFGQSVDTTLNVPGAA